MYESSCKGRPQLFRKYAAFLEIALRDSIACSIILVDVAVCCVPIGIM